jgi:hypothetical protein
MILLWFMPGQSSGRQALLLSNVFASLVIIHSPYGLTQPGITENIAGWHGYVKSADSDYLR